MAIAVAGTTQNSISGASNCVVPFPSGIQAGELLLAIACGLGTISTWTVPTGFTSLFVRTASPTLMAGYKFAAGTESGTNLVHATAQARKASCAVVRITGAHLSTPPEVGTASSGTSTTPDPPSLDPAGWATEQSLWIAMAGITGALASPTVPSGFGSAVLIGDCAGTGPTSYLTLPAGFGGVEGPGDVHVLDLGGVGCEYAGRAAGGGDRREAGQVPVERSVRFRETGEGKVWWCVRHEDAQDASRRHVRMTESENSAAQQQADLERVAWEKIGRQTVAIDLLQRQNNDLIEQNAQLVAQLQELLKDDEETQVMGAVE